MVSGKHLWSDVVVCGVWKVDKDGRRKGRNFVGFFGDVCDLIGDEEVRFRVRVRVHGYLYS